MITDTSLDRQCEKVGRFVRPLLQEIGSSLGWTGRGFVGVCFRYINDDVVVFAEYTAKDTITDPNSTTAKYAVQYRFPTSNYFEQILDPDSVDRTLTIGDEEPEPVRGPIRETFNTSPVKLQTIVLEGTRTRVESVLYFVWGAEPSNNRDVTGIIAAKGLICEMLREALFLALANDESLADVHRFLTGRLPSGFTEYPSFRETILESLRSPAPLRMRNFAGDHVPKLVGDQFHLTLDESKMLQAVMDAEEVKIIGRLSGSLRADPVFLIEVHPKRRDATRPSASYSAVVKKAEKSKARKEIEGFQKIQAHYKLVRPYLPAPQILWTIDSNYYSIVTPELAGRSLSGLAEHYWMNSKHWRTSKSSRTMFFGSVLGHAWHFLDNISKHQVSDEAEYPHRCLYSSHFCPEKKDKFEKTCRAIAFYLQKAPSTATRITYAGLAGNQTVMNPLFFLRQFANDDNTLKDELPDWEAAFWRNRTGQNRVKLFHLGHGDFHDGNILVRENVNWNQSEITVLDYDYVGEQRGCYDAATLEASFILSIASCSRFSHFDQWRRFFPDTLAYLANPETVGGAAYLEEHLFAHDLVEVLSEIRKADADKKMDVDQKVDDNYCASLVIALFRLLGSHHDVMSTRATPNNFNAARVATAVWYTGALLDRLVKAEVVKHSEVNMFVS